MTTAKQKATASVTESTTAITTIAIGVCATLLLGGLLGSNTLLSQETATQAQTAKQSKFFLALFPQYVWEDNLTSIYAPNMDDNDQTRLRVLDQSTLDPDYIMAAQNLSGAAGVTFKSSEAIVENAQRVKRLGFDFIEFNLERGLSPESDSNNVVSAMKTAADATHAHGLKFRAIPSRGFTTDYGSQIAPLVDYYHIQAQTLQDDGVKAYSDFVHTQVAELKSANPNLIISVQVSIRQGNAPDLSLLETMQQCVDSVMDVVDGVTVWFGRDGLDTLKPFVEWYNNKYNT
ncbi:MAG TPA: hypothetical protein VFR94_03135 [Nitrososphaeraceae archaeon]|nr:hypothetical protein [Nitrososphaeraceae archaeon]